MTVTGACAPGKGKQRRLKALLFDLDDTLYREHAIPTRVRAEIERYMVEHLGFDKEHVAETTLELYLKYGTTMAGLVATGHQIDYDKWHKFVHHDALDYDHLLKPDPALREILSSIDVPKFILTNADRHHAEVCLDRLGIRDLFQKVYCFESTMESAAKHGYLTPSYPVLCKPLPKAYELALEDMGCQPSEVIFFDDSPRNVQGAHELGMMSIIVGRDELVPGADMCLLDLHELPKKLPELIDQPGLVKDGHHADGSELVVAYA